MEKEGVEEREFIDKKVKQQVTQPLHGAQFKSFAQEMTSMFSQMMISQHPSHQNSAKPQLMRKKMPRQLSNSSEAIAEQSTELRKQ